MKQILDKVSAILKKEFPNQGHCLKTAQRGQELLRKEGIETRVVLGTAGWRINKSGVKAMPVPDKNRLKILWQQGTYDYGFPMLFKLGNKIISSTELDPKDIRLDYHCWLETEDHFIDFTVWLLPAQVKEEVLWGIKKFLWDVPDYLYEPTYKNKTYLYVQNNRQAVGAFSYSEDPRLITPDDPRAERVRALEPTIHAGTNRGTSLLTSA